MWSNTKAQKVQRDKYILTATVSMDWQQDAAASDSECEILIQV